MEEKIKELEEAVKFLVNQGKAREVLFEKVLMETFVTPDLRDVYREKWNEL